MVTVQQQTIIADSLPFDPNKTIENNDFGVKSDRTHPSTYNVWNEDWNNN